MSTSPVVTPSLTLRETRLEVRLKYALDRLAAALLLLLLWPLFGLIALLIVLDDGRPVFFRQVRPGLAAQTFSMWKFRTMVVNADRLLDAKGRVLGTNRITRVGRFLRKTSLDELPQLFNILRGEMSFVGPRPGALEHLPRYSRVQLGRFGMRPGITGLAQVNGRNLLRWSQRIAYDLEYIQRYSLGLDLRILFRTVHVVFLGSGMVMDRNSQDVDDLPPAGAPSADE